MPDRLRRRIQLSSSEYRLIKQLFSTCQRVDNSTPRIYWNCIKNRAADVYHDYLLYKRQLLIAYLGVFNFNATEIEICALVHPLHRRQGLFKKLVKEAISDVTYKVVERILLPCPQGFAPAKEAILSLGSTYKHSEYTLEITRLTDLILDMTPLAPHSINLTEATRDDLQIIAELDHHCFGSPLPEGLQRFGQTIGDADRQAYLAKMDEKVIGKIHLHFFENKAFIHDFCIHPDFQGKKFGHDLLMKSLAMLQQRRQRLVELDVIATNENAIKLYQKCGFELRYAYDYYELKPEVLREALKSLA